MSEIISVHASLTATDSASPVIAGLLRNVRKLEAAVKSINGVSASKLFPDSVSASLQKITDDARKAASTYRTEWKSAYADSLRDARAFHRELDRLDRQSYNHRQAEQRAVGRGATSGGRGSLPRGTSPTTALIAGGITISGVASAFKRRMEADAAEAKAQIFGGLSQAEVKRLRGDWSDQVAIKFGESAAAVLDSYTEALKQGFGGSAAKKVTENALEASSALEMNIGELMKLAGKTATSLYGNVRNADPARVARMMTSVAVAAAATAADPNEVVEANKRALSALSTTKMKETDLSAFTSVGISAGLQPNKAGTFLSYLTSEFANAGNARGQRGKDLDQAARMIGYGGRAQMAQRMASAPTEFMLDMFSKMRSMSEQNRAKFANLAGMREWRDELVQMAKAADQIRETLNEIDQKSDAVSAFSRTKLNSLQKRWDRIKAMFGLAWEKFGSGFEQSFIEVSDWFDKHTSIVTSGRIGEKSREFVERLKKAFGVSNMGEALDKIATKISSIDVDRIIGFASGFVGGLKSISDSLIIMLKATASLMGKDGNSAEVLGRLAGQIVGLSLALGLLAPVIAVLSGFANIISRIAGLLTGRALLGAASTNPVGTTALLAWLLAENNDTGISDAAKKRPGETTSQWRERQRQHKKDLYQKQSGDGFNPADVHPMSFIGNKLDNLGGKIERASLISTDFSSRGRGGLSGGTAVATNMNRIVSGVGTPDALWKNVTPGGILPNFGLGSSGIIKRSNIPSFNGGGGSVDDMSRSAFDKKFAGTPLAGRYDQIVAAARANGISPALLAGVIAHETGNGHVLSGNNVAGLMNPATGMAKKMQFGSLDAGISKAGQVVANNYRLAGGDLDKMGARYAPPGATNDLRRLNAGWPAGVRKQMNALSGGGSAGTGDAVAWAEKYKGLNEYTDNQVLAEALGGDVRGKSNAWCARFVNKALDAAGGSGTGSAVANSFQKWGSAIRPPDVKRNDVLLQTKGYGYNQPGGHVGLATGETRMQNGRLQVKMLAGNDGDAVREHWIDADKNLMVRRGNPIGQVPAPADAIKNVPESNGAITNGLLQRNNSAILGGNRGGPVAININGNSHDPEALATLVQRRVDESMNWRAHDSESEYT
ncbi:phage tail tape measure protein [Bradyrhizobium sp. 183]|uniref:phage tail tape measure protein n=1 Tax=unclassified Bradyrhizobium TaxID=2631580 RepID=UPI001FFF5D30|nr:MULTISPECIES: phage tail tape measure protein [unclassified Bradyrhizobium]UPJ81131.1 phage tail tape measure protein [Bradyrhizobium sp. 184]UPJ88925.1 phage tail tape measure protein [Bradyrhizobium sp. 183]